MIEYLDTVLAFVVVAAVGYIAWNLHLLVKIVAELAVAMAYMRELANRHDAEIIELKRRDEQFSETLTEARRLAGAKATLPSLCEALSKSPLVAASSGCGCHQ
jgi:hypothetical protein